ncbi:MAG TPA: hypothetical protein VFD30_03605 [Terriglobia bacterium]|jgi:hypothetical protein|nr:hypothetical protein [Terriglobia bacterium]
MAFIRKRGRSYYLVHNVRKNRQVQQIHLACLGDRPRITDEVIKGVAARHPFVQVDWDQLRQKTSRELVKPFENDQHYLRSLLTSIRALNLDIADLQIPFLEFMKDRELAGEILSGLKLLRGTLDVKLNQLKVTKRATDDRRRERTRP